MTISSETHPTLVDIAKREDGKNPDGPYAAPLAELLSKRIKILKDAVLVESETCPTMGNYDLYATVDANCGDPNARAAGSRFRIDRSDVKRISKAVQAQLIRGKKDGELDGFAGFYKHYSTLNADNVIDGGGAGPDNASVLLVCWNVTKIFGIYPKGTKAGMRITDKGKDTFPAHDGGQMEAYRSHCKWRFGLVIQDRRYAVRIANIDKAALDTDDLTAKMCEAVNLLPTGQGRYAFYMGKDTMAALGKSSFHGIPVRRVHAMDADKARVT